MKLCRSKNAIISKYKFFSVFGGKIEESGLGTDKIESKCAKLAEKFELNCSCRLEIKDKSDFGDTAYTLRIEIASIILAFFQNTRCAANLYI